MKISNRVPQALILPYLHVDGTDVHHYLNGHSIKSEAVFRAPCSEDPAQSRGYRVSVTKFMHEQLGEVRQALAVDLECDVESLPASLDVSGGYWTVMLELLDVESHLNWSPIELWSSGYVSCNDWSCFTSMGMAGVNVLSVMATTAAILKDAINADSVKLPIVLEAVDEQRHTLIGRAARQYGFGYSVLNLVYKSTFYDEEEEGFMRYCTLLIPAEGN